MQRITPHSFYDSAYVSSEVEFVPELGVTTSHLDV